MCNVSYTFSTGEIDELRKDLLAWYDDNKRDLPWRKTDKVLDQNQHAYSVWVSEIMLQQTRVATVVDYYKRWMKKWPDVKSLAESTEEEVNEMWSGLGYYSRGRRLREGAIKVIQSCDGKIPASSAELLKLPGIGRYTAAAIASIAFHEACGVLDGNVIRVLCRLQCIGGNSASKEVLEHLWNLTNDVVDKERPGDLNQALMELGATVCLPKGPKCSTCPIKSRCKAHKQVLNHQKSIKKCKTEKETVFSASKVETEIKLEIKDELTDIEDCNNNILALPSSVSWDPEIGVMNYPQKVPKKAPRSEHIIVLAMEIINDLKMPECSKWLIAQRPKKGLLAGLWEFPNKACLDGASFENKENKTKKRKHSSDMLDKTEIDPTIVLNGCNELMADFMKTVRTPLSCDFVGSFLHVFSHIHQTNHVAHFRVNAAETDFHSSRPFKLVTSAELQKSAVSSSVMKILKLSQQTNDTNYQAGTNKRKKSNQPSIDSFFKPSSKK
uniref:Adenine DNA glycosylase n=1 Tax=Phallusia mammillata TaxID=59560 RepID=A0A6F9DM28_9ASCI|nr:A/G-specific adenine DNA glycosylase-like [Phallusia mammillata]